MTRRQRQANLSALLVGLLATGVVLTIYALGGLEWLELETLDRRFIHANSIKDDAPLVCIDIDDTTLDKLGRWPWHRDRQAPLIEILAELGARRILVDLTWNEPETKRHLGYEALDITHDRFAAGADDSGLFVLPDDVLRATLAEAGNAYLAYDYSPRDLERSDEFNRAVDALQRKDTAEVERQLELLKSRRTRDGLKAWTDAERRPRLRVRMVAALEANSQLDERSLAAQLAIDDEDFVQAAFERCQRAALRRYTRAWLDAEPDQWQSVPYKLFHALYQKVTEQAYEGETPVGEALIVALREVLCYEATTQHPLVPLETIEPIASRVEGISPIHFMHADVARRCGFVVFEADSDKTVRRMPLFAVHRGQVLTQLALALVCDELGLGPEHIVAQPGRLVLQRPEGDPLVIPLDERGRALVPWVPKTNWLEQFTHIAADDVYALYEHRERLAHNQRGIRSALKVLLANPLFAELAEDADVINAVNDLETQRRAARYQGNWQKARDVADFLRSFEEQIPEIEKRVRERAAEIRERPASTPEDQISAEPAQLLQVTRELGRIDRSHAANAELQDVVEDYLRRLRAYVDGKICLIGYTATSLADMKPIPTNPSAPGVMAHANLLNGLLTGRMVSWAGTPLNVALATILGVAASVVSVSRPPRVALAIIVGAVILFIALAGWLAFYWWRYWIHLTPALGTMLLSFVAIAVYRYFFVDYERRQLATALGQYTSRSIADKVAEDPELCRRAEMREVTAMFTDLKGFTTISENIGAERTQNLLNACLGRFTEVMLGREAMVNKFIGDGIFAFWNPVIYSQPDHARLACETAIDLLAALRALIDEQRQAGGDEAFGELVLRIGVATGKAIVGPCGSEQKFDYTCIGDSVNVASRLESANKFYGTHILVNDVTRQQVDRHFEFRPLGGVQVKGRRQAVQIAELLGRAGQVDEQSLEYAREFGQAVALFQRRDWSAARTAFETCAAQRPDDLAGQHYAAAAKAFLQQPPGDDWNGAIELMEK